MMKAPRPSDRLKVKVVPGSSQDEIVGWLVDALKIRVMAPPEKGRANESVVELRVDRLGLTTDAFSVVSGHSSPSKMILTRRDDETIKRALGQPPFRHPA